MNPIKAVLLGIIQGLTEFLPVSSSGHLVLFQNLFGLTEPELFFDVSVHMGTLAAVVYFFRKEIVELFRALGRLYKLAGSGKLKEAWEDAHIRLGLCIIIGSVPTAVIGLALKSVEEVIFTSVFLVGCMLLVTGGMLWLTRYLDTSERSALSVKNATIIGISQGLAVLPGISRSGTTISIGLFLGLDRTTAARFSFLLSIPAILGAEILSLADLSGATHIGSTLAGTLAAFITGYFALKFLIFIVNNKRLHYFAPYCWIVGVFSLIIAAL